MERLGELLRASRTIAREARPTAKPLSLAVVIPALDEQSAIGATLRSLQRQTAPAERVILSDGGSTDRTTRIAEELGAEVLHCPRRGRGGQIAYAVERLEEEIVLIGHADMTFSLDALAEVRRTLEDNAACPGGCLGHRFEPHGFVLRMVEFWDRRRATRRGTSYGDQAQFFRRVMLDAVGGFPDQPIMEDIELSRRLETLGRPVYLDTPVRVSERRFRQLGYVRTAWTNYRLRRAYQRRGLSVCQELYERYYPKHLE